MDCIVHGLLRVGLTERLSPSPCVQPLPWTSESELCADQVLLFMCIFFGCTGSLLLCTGFLQLQQVGATFIAVCGLLTVVASLTVEHRLYAYSFSSCSKLQLVGSRAWALLWCMGQPLRGMWDLPAPVIEPVSPVPAGGFLSTAPPGKFSTSFLSNKLSYNVFLFLYHDFELMLNYS